MIVLQPGREAIGLGFGDELRALRIDKGLSQHVLAVELGMRHGNVHGHYAGLVASWERGRRVPRRESVDLIAEVLKCTPEERTKLMISAGHMPQGFAEDPVTQEILALIAQMSPRERRMLRGKMKEDE